MNNKFFTFIKPYLSFIDNGHFYRKPFMWLYALLAIVNLIVPFFVLIQGIDNGIFEYGFGKIVFVFLLLLVIITFVSWISFQLWWDRKEKVSTISVEGDEFTATPVFSHFFQTFGEWLGTWIGIVGFSVALCTTLILGDDADYFDIGIPFLETGFLFVILMPIYGFLIVVGARFLAEQFRALSSIANNTKR